MIQKKTPEQLREMTCSGKCTGSALINYNTDDATVTIPYGYFKEIHDRIIPDRYIRAELKVEIIRKMINQELEERPDEPHYMDFDQIRMVIDDE